jgi:hypothetical protein
MWIKTDPRHLIYKRANIIILRPSILGRFQYEAGTGHVETKNDWSIDTSFTDHSSIETWDKDWLWTRFPDITTL